MRVQVDGRRQPARDAEQIAIDPGDGPRGPGPSLIVDRRNSDGTQRAAAFCRDDGVVGVHRDAALARRRKRGL